MNLVCRWCGVKVPDRVMKGKPIDREIWASYHIRYHHRDKIPSLAKRRAKWLKGFKKSP